MESEHQRAPAARKRDTTRKMQRGLFTGGAATAVSPMIGYLHNPTLSLYLMGEIALATFCLTWGVVLAIRKKST